MLKTSGLKRKMKTFQRDTFASVRWFCFCLVFLSLFSGCEDTNLELAAEAGLDAVRAVTLSDDQVYSLAQKASQASDARHMIAPDTHPQAFRLRRLVGNHPVAGGYSFDLKVYLLPQVNAFAMADGTIRIYSGLMEMMDDAELRFVIGHEMGHIVHQHIRKKIMVAYAASAVRKGIASQENMVGNLAGSAIGSFFQLLVNARFSQSEEKQADDFGAQYLRQHQVDPMAAVSALKKLDTLGNDHTFLSSHPEPAKRAARILETITSSRTQNRGYIPKKDPVPVSFFSKIFNQINHLMGRN